MLLDADLSATSPSSGGNEVVTEFATLSHCGRIPSFTTDCRSLSSASAIKRSKYVTQIHTVKFFFFLLLKYTHTQIHSVQLLLQCIKKASDHIQEERFMLIFHLMINPAPSLPVQNLKKKKKSEQQYILQHNEMNNNHVCV